MTQAQQETWIQRYWPVLVIGGAWLWLFWPMMLGRTVVGFRDSASLYYPYFKWIDAQWAAGEIPLWNPYCNWGYPVVADGTSSVFYPGKLIFFCRFLSYPARYGIYLAIHIPIAATGTYWFARTLKANRAGATLAAFSFAFGGSVLFQVTNVIYLVSAAWLPFALCCVWQMTKTGQLRWAIAAGACCALMILGGDPQMVYHVGLIAVATIIGEFWRRRRRRLRTASAIKSSPYRWLAKSSMALGGMVLVTIVLSAIQLLPTFFWSQHSERTNPRNPANIYMALDVMINPESSLQSVKANSLRKQVSIFREVYGDSVKVVPPLVSSSHVNIVEEVKSSLLGPPTGTVDHSYQFSQPPWSLAELLWPNVSGRPFPIHQRWTSSLPGADRVWVPSIYMGLLVLLIALTGIRLWGRRRKQVWLSWLLVFFLLASFGWYGVVWLHNEFALIDRQSNLGPQVGGIYWFMNMVLPKYFAFRYPAKLFVIASLAISLLAGTSLRTFRVRQMLFMVIAFVLLTLLTAFGFRIWFAASLESIGSDDWFGPFDSVGASRAIYFSVAHALIVAACIGGFCWYIRIRKSSTHRLALAVLVVLSVVDVVVANSWLLTPVDAARFESSLEVYERIASYKKDSRAEPVRIFRARNEKLEPDGFEWTRSEDRLDEIVSWQRETLYPKHHLEQNVILMGSFSSIWPSSYQRNLDFIEWRQDDLYGIGADAIVVAPSGMESSSPSQIRQISKRYWSDRAPSSGLVELDLNPAVGSAMVREAMEGNRFKQKSANESEVSVTEFKSNRFVVRVSLDEKCWLRFGRVADTGWHATVKDLSTNAITPAVLQAERSSLVLPLNQAGEYEVEFVYSPIEFWVGAWISSIAWGLLVLCASWHFFWKLKPPRVKA